MGSSAEYAPADAARVHFGSHRGGGHATPRIVHDDSVDAPPPPPITVIEVVYPAERGAIGLRGSQEPPSWENTTQPSEVRRGSAPVNILLQLLFPAEMHSPSTQRSYT